jgi:hypothetical protein
LNPDKRRKQDVHVASFNFLDGSGMKPHHFGESFLRDSLKHSFTADISAE